MFKKKWFWLIIISMLWEFTTQVGIIPSFVIPPLSVITQRTYELFLHEHFLEVILSSLKTIFQGFLISFIGAVLTASIAVYCEGIETLVLTLHDIFNPLPSVAILPIVLLFTGLTTRSMHILIIHAVFWPLVSTLIMSFHSIPQEYRNFATNIRLSNWKTCLFIFLPAIFPYLLSGIRNSWGRAWRSLISAEAIFYISGSQHGLGYWIYKNRSYANMCDVMVGVLTIIIISILVEKLFQLIETHTIRKWGMTK